ncbi:hypothetical protein ARMGADRAFT_566526 [Armillaria gallica]|uniref:Uncharacterized protein n=1 Tax=Armillaria gallica TaxID=47427 RepID=A0A2H3DS57_ARMGA|nr:hypothetical protein ARMGADRAFT_566526 [Armillaria gallica]
MVGERTSMKQQRGQGSGEEEVFIKHRFRCQAAYHCKTNPFCLSTKRKLWRRDCQDIRTKARRVGRTGPVQWRGCRRVFSLLRYQYANPGITIRRLPDHNPYQHEDRITEEATPNTRFWRANEDGSGIHNTSFVEETRNGIDEYLPCAGLFLPVLMHNTDFCWGKCSV